MLSAGLLKEHSRIISFVLRSLDVAVIVLTGLGVYYYKFGDLDLSPYYMAALISSVLLTLVIFPFFHVYESSRAQSFWQYIRKLFQGMAVLVLLLGVFAFLTKTGELFSREWFIGWAISSFILLTLFRCTVIIVLRLMRAHGLNERHVVVIGAGALGRQLVEKMQHAMWTGLRVTTIFDDFVTENTLTICGIPVMPTPRDLSAYLAANRKEVDEIWLALPMRAESRVKEILHELRHDMVTTRLILDIFGLDLLNHSVTHFSGIPVLNIRSTPMIGLNRFIKALEDRVLASLILLLISPLFLMIAMAVKLSSPGPIFYRQKRVGWNGEEFDMLKFRTMPVDAESKTGPVWAKPGENRATKIGTFLRKTSLDELPQFVNVLCGDMSIVGPRPERLVFVEQFKDQIPRYMQKHFVKAGITGWAQINGWRGNTSLEKRIEYDLYYIENWSLAFDLKIIFLTFFQGFINKNAY